MKITPPNQSYYFIIQQPYKIKVFKWYKDIIDYSDTLDKVNLLLKQLEGNNDLKNNNNKDDIEEEDIDEDEDIQKYLKSLESK